jgi:hypothetical protein
LALSVVGRTSASESDRVGANPAGPTILKGIGMSDTYRKERWGWEFLSKELAHRDKKKGYKPGSIYKRIAKAQRRAKEKEALRNGRDIPVFRRSDEWHWL